MILNVLGLAGHNTTLLAVYDGSDTLVARFEYGVGRMPVRMTQGEDTYYFAYDHVGSLRAVFDDAGALVHEITYDSYGNIESETTTQGFESVYIPPFGFAGGLQDRDTGLVLFGFRDYDPETGTWLTPDPIGFAGGDTYLYAYCGGDPVNWVDPDGLLAWYDQLLNGSANVAAGFGDAITCDLTRLARYGMGTGDFVDTGSGAYGGGQVGGMIYSLFVGPTRLAYAGLNKVSSIRYLSKGATFQNAFGSYKFRAVSKDWFNFGTARKPRSFLSLFHQYNRDFGEVIRASGRTNPIYNALGIYLTGIGAKEGYENYLGIDSIFSELYDAYDHLGKMKVLQ